MFKKIFIFSFLSLFSVLTLTGCGSAPKPTLDYGTLDQEGYYNYQNPELGFTIRLPKEFEYYQTQRWNQTGYTDLEILVPTGDPGYKGSVEGYGTPITVRVYTDKSLYDDVQSKTYVKAGETNKKLYAVRFWEEIPADWKDKWSEEVQKTILENFSN